MLRRPYAYLPPVQYRDQSELAPKDLQEWFQEKARAPTGVEYEHIWGPNYH